MKLLNLLKRKDEEGSIIGYFVIATIILSSVAAVSGLVSNNYRNAKKRNDAVYAMMFAEGGAAMGCQYLKAAFLSGDRFTNHLVTNANFVHGGTDPSGANTILTNVITAPYTNQAVAIQISYPSGSSPRSAKVTAIAKVGDITRSVSAVLGMKFAFGAAIISDNSGDWSGTSVGKADAQNGNVSVEGKGSASTAIFGGILANGNANFTGGGLVTIETNTISQQLYGTADEIPDYTADGSPHQLFDFDRFIAASDAMGMHFPNMVDFVNAMNASNALGALMEGIIVIDVGDHSGGCSSSANWDVDAKGWNDEWSDEADWFDDTDVSACGKKKKKKKKKGGPPPPPPPPPPPGGAPPEVEDTLKSEHVPDGVNINGTLIFNFGSDYSPTDKYVNTAAMNINAADLSSWDPQDENTYTTGYPPTYVDTTKKPWTVDISGSGFENFSATDDLPAMMYNIGIYDVHGPVNISGVVYSPSFFEIENKQNGQTQYFNGALIGGGGVYIQNNKTGSKTGLAFDPDSLDFLATMDNKGKSIQANYWE